MLVCLLFLFRNFFSFNDDVVNNVKRVKIYFFAVVVVLGADLVDFFDGCVRFVRFFASVLVVSAVKYEVMFDNNDENDQVDFFGVV